jgi:hypothetical protein
MVFPDQPEGDFSLTRAVSIYAWAALDDVLDEDEELQLLVKCAVEPTRRKGASKAIMAPTNKRLFIFTSEKKMLGRIGFEDIRVVDYADVKITSKRSAFGGLDEARGWHYDVDVTYKLLGKSRTRTTQYGVRPAVAAYLEDLVHTHGPARPAPVEPVEPPASPATDAGGSLEIARRRLAAGEITIEEFEKLKQALTS